MAIESATYINQLDATKPGSGDPKSEGDDHLRLLKSTVKATFPNVTGAVTPTHTDLNYVAGVTSAIQTQIDTKGAVAGQTWTGTQNFTGATTTVATQVATDNTTKAASTAYVQAALLASSVVSAQLPAQSGNSGKFLTTNGTAASWGDAGSLVRSARTSNTVLGAADKSTLIDITSGTFTQTFDAAASLGNGWFCYIRNSGTGDITLDPNASETIDGLTSYIMYPGEVRLVQCDGSALRTVVIQSFNRTFTTTGTFTKPPGYAYFAGIGWGGGASGARSNSASTLSRGGGGGGSFPFQIAASKFGTTETITIGAGGAAYTGTSGTTHNAGGDTTIGSLLTIRGATNNGGSGFGGATANPVGFEGVLNTAATFANPLGIYGGGNSTSTPAGNGNGSLFGGAAGGGCDTGGTAYNGGTSLHGGNGGNASSASNGQDGAAPGGGGGATQTGTQSGAGGRGEVRIWGIV